MIDSDLGLNQQIWQVVSAIPPGKVSTYGAVARKAGLARAARRAGFALRGLPADSRIPWHRVVNAKGGISFPKDSESYKTQRQRLEKEGVHFRANGSIDLCLFGW